MFKQMTTLFRGALSQSSEDFSDKHALLLLKQQLRDCAHVVSESRRAVAIAIAQNEQEANQHKQVKRKITELEVRAVAAIEKNEMELATEAAETISILEAERDISAKAQDQFNSEITRLKNIVHTAEKKLKELQRGQRLAAATDKTQKIRAAHPASTLANFKDAEETLLSLQQRQRQIDTTAKVISEQDYYLDNRYAVGMSANLLKGDKIIRIFPTHDTAQEQVQPPILEAALTRSLIDTTT